VTQPTRSTLIEDFRGDFEQLAAMLRASWEENATPGFLYTPAFLADLFRYPGASFSLAPTLYLGAEPVAFVAGFPRRVRLDGNDLQILVIALLTVAKTHKSAGYGIHLWTELVRRARVAGFDGVLNYCVEGGAMNRMIEGACRRAGISCTRIHTVSYLSRVLLRSKDDDASGAACDFSPSEFVSLASTAAASVPLARSWNESEAAWQCSREGGVSVCRETSEARRGLLTGYVMAIANAARTKCLIVEDILWHELERDERDQLAGHIAAAGAAAGASVVIVPVLGYADTSPFAAAKFRESGQKIHAYLSLWNGPQPQDALPGYYLDVF
jgi:hypothetical protein